MCSVSTRSGESTHGIHQLLLFIETETALMVHYTQGGLAQPDYSRAALMNRMDPSKLQACACRSAAAPVQAPPAAPECGAHVGGGRRVRQAQACVVVGVGRLTRGALRSIGARGRARHAALRQVCPVLCKRGGCMQGLVMHTRHHNRAHARNAGRAALCQDRSVCTVLFYA